MRSPSFQPAFGSKGTAFCSRISAVGILRMSSAVSAFFPTFLSSYMNLGWWVFGSTLDPNGLPPQEVQGPVGARFKWNRIQTSIAFPILVASLTHREDK